jgi:hypothetical protein
MTASVQVHPPERMIGLVDKRSQAARAKQRMDEDIQVDRLSEQAGQQLRLAEVEMSVIKQERVIAALLDTGSPQPGPRKSWPNCGRW